MQTHTQLFADGAVELRQEHLSSLITWSYKLPNNSSISPHILQLQYDFNDFKSPTAHNTIMDIYSILLTAQHLRLIKTLSYPQSTEATDWVCVCFYVLPCSWNCTEASARSENLTPGGRSDIRMKKAHERLQGLSQTEAQTLNLTVERVIVIVLHQKPSTTLTAALTLSTVHLLLNSAEKTCASES